jgi:hypothetical protein
MIENIMPRRHTDKNKQKTERIHLRFSPEELELLLTCQEKRIKVGSDRWSQAAVIVDALRFANGEIIF